MRLPVVSSEKLGPGVPSGKRSWKLANPVRLSPRNIDELENWTKISLRPKPIDPFEVLTDDEVAQVVRAQ